MQVPLLQLDEHHAKGSSEDKDAGGEEDQVLQELSAEVHTEEPIERRSESGARWKRKS